MDSEYTFTLMVPDMRVSGKRTDKTAMVSKLGQMEPSMKANILMAKRMAEVPSSGQMVQSTTENSVTTTFMEMVSTSGQMEEGMKAHGSTTKWTAGVYSLGKTAENMTVNTKTIRKKDKAPSDGQMVDNMLAHGTSANNMG